MAIAQIFIQHKSDPHINSVTQRAALLSSLKTRSNVHSCTGKILITIQGKLYICLDLNISEKQPRLCVIDRVVTPQRGNEFILEGSPRTWYCFIWQ